MRNLILALAVLFFLVSCSDKENKNEKLPSEDILEYGGDFSIMKKLEDAGGEYKINGEAKEGLQIF